MSGRRRELKRRIEKSGRETVRGAELGKQGSSYAGTGSIPLVWLERAQKHRDDVGPYQVLALPPVSSGIRFGESHECTPHPQRTIGAAREN